LQVLADAGQVVHHLDAEALELATGADSARSFGTNRDPALFQSNFAPLRKDVCATYHQPAKAGESCQLCHNYHTGEMVPLRLPAAEFSKPRPPR